MSIDNPANTRERAIKHYYLTHLGRRPDQEGWDYYTSVNWSTNLIEQDIRGSLEYWRRNTIPRYSVAHGGDSHKQDTSTTPARQFQHFGGADYIEALKTGGVQNLARTRKDILEWLESGNFRWLQEEHRPGGVDPNMPGGIGLYDRIKGSGSPARDINPGWGDYSDDPAAGTKFDYADLLATRALRFSDEEIKSVLDVESNQDWLKDHDKPGVQGGLYENLDIPYPETEDPWVPSPPTRTATPSEFNVDIERSTVGAIDRESLKIGSIETFVGKRARGMERAKDLGRRTNEQGKKIKRKKLRQTTDLQRSLNIS